MDGLILPLPEGWFGADHTPVSVGAYWSLTDHDPRLDDRGRIFLTIRTWKQAVDEPDIGCPPRQEEDGHKIDVESCSFTTFAGLRWRRLVASSEGPFIEFMSLDRSRRRAYRLIGSYAPSDQEARSLAEQILRGAHF